eukprot:COSAG01_NODE_17663_length_1133_cov_1.136364_2_plen_208_part_00
MRGGASGGPSRYCALKGGAFCANPPSSPCAGCTDASGACHCDSGITAGCERKPGCVPDDPETCAGGGAPPPPPPPSPPRADGVEVSLQVSALMANGSRVVTLSPGSHTFQMLEGEEELSVRVVVDRSIAGVLFELEPRVIGYGAANLSQLCTRVCAEFFFARGRAALTSRYYPEANETGVELTVSEAAATWSSVVVHEMGCGWVDSV